MGRHYVHDSFFNFINSSTSFPHIRQILKRIPLCILCHISQLSRFVVMMYTYYILLGSNLGESEALVDKARRLIDMHIGSITKASNIYKTEPWGEKDQNYFVNQAIKLQSRKEPNSVLIECQRIEAYLGKHKITKYGPRLIDIDILLVDDIVIDEPQLTVPHPKLHERNFVLIPLSDIAEAVIHPISGMTITELKANCKDTGTVEILR